jgi:hypothetical protein
MPRAFPEAAIEAFRGHVHTACAELEFDLDEIGISEWEDMIERRVIVPLAMRGQSICHSVHRNLKHISAVTYISAPGEHLTPFMVCSQGNEPVERLLERHGFRYGVDLLIRKRNEPYTNSQLFREYISTVLLSYIDEMRTNNELADNEAALLRDNCCIHLQAETRQMLAGHQVKVITFPPHTSHIFQSLDLSGFGNVKNKMNDRLPLDSDDTTAGFIKRIFHTMKQTLAEDNVRGSFTQIGLQYHNETSPYFLSFDEAVLRQSSGFTSLWHRDYPLERLSRRGQNAPFGRVNQTMRPECHTQE